MLPTEDFRDVVEDREQRTGSLHLAVVGIPGLHSSPSCLQIPLILPWAAFYISSNNPVAAFRVSRTRRAMLSLQMSEVNHVGLFPGASELSAPAILAVPLPLGSDFLRGLMVAPSSWDASLSLGAPLSLGVWMPAWQESCSVQVLITWTLAHLVPVVWVTPVSCT